MDENIKGRLRTNTGKTYIFLKDGSLLEEYINGDTIKVDLSIEENIKRIKEEIGKGQTDIIE